MDERRSTIASIVHAGAPMSVRHAFYQAVGAGIGIPKNKAGYRQGQRVVLELRRAGTLSYNEIVDGTRSRRTITQYDGLDDALGDIWATYRRNLWSDSDYDVEVWCESDSIFGTIAPVVQEWGVPWCVTRGYASETLLYNAAHAAITDILYVGDLDPHGLDIERHARDTMAGFGSRPDWQRIAITEEQVTEYNLPTSYGEGHGVEAEAMPAEMMRGLVQAAIRRFVDADAVAVIRAVEEEERRGLLRLQMRHASDEDEDDE